MKTYFLKGLYFFMTLSITHKIIYYISNFNEGILHIIFPAFALIVFLYLKNQNSIKSFLASGFSALILLILSETILIATNFYTILDDDFGTISSLIIYFIGFMASLPTIFIAFIFVFIKKEKEVTIMENDNIKIPKQKSAFDIKSGLKIKLAVYAFLSAISFSYLILPENSGIGVIVFAFIQAIWLYFISENKKRLFLFIPVCILALNSFISANTMWRISNVVVCMFLYSLMFTDFRTSFFTNFIKNTFLPFSFFKVPFFWVTELDSKKTAITKRIIKALLITVPVVIILLILLSSADLVFQNNIDSMMSEGINSINLNTTTKIIAGIIAGLYLFGVIYNSYINKNKEYNYKIDYNADMLIIGIIFIAILIVYTYFVVIQFKYLFAMSELPYNLSYTEYARRGFFELIFLTGINISVIMATLFFTKKKAENNKKIRLFTKVLCCYLCLITIILLISSFYRMWLYSNDDGLTRLRFMVFGFLIFEAIGLLYTFIHIIKPYFNLAAVYLIIGLSYYLILNIIPIDYYVAKSQIDMYLCGKRNDISYTYTLSADAAPQIKRLYDTNEEENAEYFFTNHAEYYKSIPKRWQRYNIRVQSCIEEVNKIE